VSDRFYTRLKEGHQELDALYQDTYAPVTFRQDWRGVIFARRSLGEAQVHAWRLGEYFLLAWSDWHGLLTRYLRYFGRAPAGLPKTWQRLSSQCESLSAQMAQDAKLGHLVSGAWHGPVQQREASAETVAHRMVVQHRRLVLLSLLESSGNQAEERMARQAGVSAWEEGRESARQFDDALDVAYRELSGRAQAEVLWQLRHYRRVNLLASWLLPPGLTDPARPASALLRVLNSEKPMMDWIDQVVGQLQADPNTAQLVRGVLERSATAISDFSYDDFVEDVSSGAFQGGEESPTGSGAINLIPSKDRGACSPVLVAVSKGDKRALGFMNTMRLVREHLIECWTATRVVIVLCDHWSRAMLDEHSRDLRAHHRRGVRFVFLLAGEPGNVLAPVSVDLSRAA
jgi:hypothetical protein